MIFGDFLKAVRQLPDPRFRRVLVMGLGLTLGLLIALYGVVIGAIQYYVSDTLTLPWVGQVSGVDAILSWAVVPILLVASVFLMAPVASIFTGFFLEQITDAVEARHYPHLTAPLQVPLYEQIKDALNFFALLVLLNILAFVMALFAGPFAPVVFWAVNGFLLGREYFTLVAMRRLGRDKARALRGRHMGTVWLAGVLMAIPLTVPVVNLLIPLLGVATFTHLFHRLNGSGRPMTWGGGR